MWPAVSRIEGRLGRNCPSREGQRPWLVWRRVRTEKDRVPRGQMPAEPPGGGGRLHGTDP